MGRKLKVKMGNETMLSLSHNAPESLEVQKWPIKIQLMGSQSQIQKFLQIINL
jgi:hypothetical protein